MLQVDPALTKKVLYGIPGSMTLGLAWIGLDWIGLDWILAVSLSICCGAAAGPFRPYGGLLSSW
ncbi:hypothetical protein ACIKP7_16505, partial [Pseudomonas caricapapayae]